MRKIKIILCILFISITISKYLYAQEKKNSISLSGSAAYYFGIHDFGKPKGEEVYRFPISPGGQVIYWRNIFDSGMLGLGINYQKIHYQSSLDSEDPFYGWELKFIYKELSIPLLFRKDFQSESKDHYYFTLGAYNGWQQNIKMQSRNSAGWQTWGDNSRVGGYSNDNFFTDLYLDAGYALPLGSLGELSLAPFYKYRINSTWVNTYLKKSIVGINLNYSFKF